MLTDGPPTPADWNNSTCVNGTNGERWRGLHVQYLQDGCSMLDPVTERRVSGCLAAMRIASGKPTRIVTRASPPQTRQLLQLLP